MIRMNRKGFFRTLEVLVAIVLTFFFVTYLMPKFTATETPQKHELDILSRLSEDDSFRNCIMEGDMGCVETRINLVIPSGYSFDTSISNDVNYRQEGLPTKDIYIESVFISSNITQYNPQIVKVYYWKK